MLHKKRKRQFDYFESRNPPVVRKMKPDPKVVKANHLDDPVKRFHKQFCKVR